MTANDRATRNLDRVTEYRRTRAEFCIATGVQPSEYDNLTQADISAFIEAANRTAQK